MSLLINKISTQTVTETADIFISYLRLVTYTNILSVNCIPLRGVVDPTVAFEPKNVGWRPDNHICFFFFFFFFSLLLLQCKFNINLMSLLRFSNFFILCCPGLQRLQGFDYRYLLLFISSNSVARYGQNWPNWAPLQPLSALGMSGMAIHPLPRSHCSIHQLSTLFSIDIAFMHLTTYFILYYRSNNQSSLILHYCGCICVCVEGGRGHQNGLSLLIKE